MNFQANEATGVQTLLQPADWEAQFAGDSFEKAVCLRIVGWLACQQTANGTTATGCNLAYAVCVRGFTETVVIDPQVQAVMGSRDVMHIGGWALSSTASGANNLIQKDLIDIRVKRKLTSDQVIDLVARINIDAAAPTCQVVGQFRILVDRK